MKSYLLDLLFQVGRRLGLAGALAVAIHAGGALQVLNAGDCEPPATACQAYSQSPMIFLGTVMEDLPSTETWITRFRMRIDRAYKGVSEEGVDSLRR